MPTGCAKPLAVLVPSLAGPKPLQPKYLCGDKYTGCSDRSGKACPSGERCMCREDCWGKWGGEKNNNDAYCSGGGARIDLPTKCWFHDSVSMYNSTCQGRISTFNNECGRTDALTHWGVQPTSEPTWVKGGNGLDCGTVCATVRASCDSTAQSNLITNALVVAAFLEAGYTCRGNHGARDYAGTPFSTSRSDDCAPMVSGATPSSCTENSKNHHSALCRCVPMPGNPTVERSPAPSPSAGSPGGGDGVIGTTPSQATADSLLPAWCWEDFLVELQPQATDPTDDGSGGVKGADQLSELPARVNAAVYGKNYGNAGAFAPLDGLFLAVAGGGERATVVLSSDPACSGAANVSVTVGGKVAPVYNRSKNGRRITVTLPPYDIVCPSLEGSTAIATEQCGSGGSKTIAVKSSGMACKPGYEKGGSGKYCYKKYVKNLNWTFARAFCQMDGSDLAIIASEKDDEFFANKTWKQVWIGLSDVRKEGNWVYVDGTTLPLMGGNRFWVGKNEPNGEESENCVTINGLKNWNDLPCSMKRPSFVCGYAASRDEVSWSCPPSCPSGQATTTNRSMLHPSNTEELRAAVGGITYVRRCADTKRRLQQNNDSTSPPSVSPVSSSTSSMAIPSQCAKAMNGIIPFVTDPRSCLDPARAQSAPCAYGEGSECECCPANARCPGGARTWPVRGYWVSSENSTVVTRCDPPQMERCLGMVHGSRIGNQCGVG